MKAMKWPWSKKTTDNNAKVEDKSINLRDPDKKKEIQKLESQDAMTEIMVDVANDATTTPIEECPAIFLMCECGKAHFRHTGYIETIVPYIGDDGNKTVGESHMVKTCCSCRKSYVSIGPKTYDVTDKIDIKAWEKFEKEAHKATGPGGNC